MNRWAVFALGALAGAAAFWLYNHRDLIGFAVKNRDRISAAGNLVDDLKGVLG